MLMLMLAPAVFALDRNRGQETNSAFVRYEELRASQRNG